MKHHGIGRRIPNFKRLDPREGNVDAKARCHPLRDAAGECDEQPCTGDDGEEANGVGFQFSRGIFNREQIERWNDGGKLFSQHSKRRWVCFCHESLADTSGWFLQSANPDRHDETGDAHHHERSLPTLESKGSGFRRIVRTPEFEYKPT